MELKVNHWTLYLLWWLTSGERNLGRKAVTLIGVKQEIYCHSNLICYAYCHGCSLKKEPEKVKYWGRAEEGVEGDGG